jgi:SAM-dependent methyltransferase
LSCPTGVLPLIAPCSLKALGRPSAGDLWHEPSLSHHLAHAGGWLRLSAPTTLLKGLACQEDIILLRQYLKTMRAAAVAEYERCILGFLEPSVTEVKLLDCGCDDGAWTLRLASSVGSVRLFGVEIVEPSRLLALEKGVDARAGDLNGRFPFPDDCFDVVHANQVIEHLSDTDSFITEIGRVLRPGGYAIICTENLASWHNIFALVMGWQPFSLTNVSDTRFQLGNPLAIHAGEGATNPSSWQHMRVFAYRGLREVFQQHGFVVERCQGSGYYPLPGWLGKLDPRHAAFLTMKLRAPQ